MNERTIGDILRDVESDFQDLVRSEIHLARTEISEQAKRAKGAGGAIAGAAIAGLLAAMCLVTLCVVVLASVMPLWAAALIMTFILAAIALVMFTVATERLRGFHAIPKQTADSLKEDLQWAKHRIS